MAKKPTGKKREWFTWKGKKAREEERARELLAEQAKESRKKTEAVRKERGRKTMEAARARFEGVLEKEMQNLRNQEKGSGKSEDDLRRMALVRFMRSGIWRNMAMQELFRMGKKKGKDT